MGDTLTFGDLLEREASNDTSGKAKKASLLGKLSSEWKRISSPSVDAQVVLKTNRVVGNRDASAGSAGQKHLRPALDEFWPELVSQRDLIADIEDFRFSDEWTGGWQELLQELEPLTKSEKLEFLRSLTIETGQPDLGEIDERLTRRVSELLGTSGSHSTAVMQSLYASLRKWATTLRGSAEEVDRAELFVALALNSGANRQVGDHLFSPPAPFFSTREPFVMDLEVLLKSPQCRAVFVTGPPGCGKTSVLSHLANRRDPVIDFRFFTFKPIEVGSAVDGSEAQLASPEALWGDLLCQLRETLRGRLHAYNVALRNDFLTAQQRKEQFLSACAAWARERGSPVVIAIDGIDHAARSKRLSHSLPSFLASLPAPENLPEGVRLLIGGQPGYPEYPTWLRREHELVKVLQVPGLEPKDVSELLKSRKVNYPDLETAAATIHDYCKGNTLATLFAVREAETCDGLVSLAGRLQQRKLGSDLSTYLRLSTILQTEITGLPAVSDVWSAPIVSQLTRMPVASKSTLRREWVPARGT